MIADAKMNFLKKDMVNIASNFRFVGSVLYLHLHLFLIFFIIALYLDRKPNMHFFVQDVKQAELKIKGDPDILSNEKYHPPPRPDYASIFGSTPKQKKITASVGRGRGRRKTPAAETPPNNSISSTKVSFGFQIHIE